MGTPAESTLEQIPIECGDILDEEEPVPSFVLQIEDSSDVVLRNLFITGGEGVSISDSSVIFAGAVEVTLSRFSGVEIRGSTGRTRLLGNVHNRIHTNCRHGIFVGSQGSLTVAGTTLIEDNGAFGVTGRDGASLAFGQQCSVNHNGSRVTKGGNADLVCDSTSVLVGDFSMVDNIQCASAGGGGRVIEILE